MIRIEKKHHRYSRPKNNPELRYGGLFGGSASPPSPPPIPPAASPQTLANPASSQASAVSRSQAAAAAGAGFDNTLVNQSGAAGLVPTPSQTAGRSLLG